MSDSDNDLLTAPPGQDLHDLRAVYDIGNLRLDAGVNAGDSPWSVLRVSPDPHSGSATLIGAAIDGKTGRIVDAASGKPADEASMPAGMIEEGSWAAITRIGAPMGKQQGRYKWTKPLEHDKRKLGPDDIYLPFSNGGTVLCRHNPQMEGTPQFSSVNLLPSGWEAHVPSAFDAVRKNKVLSGSAASNADKTSLTAMLPNANAIISALAFRSLSENGNLDTQTIQQTLSKASGYQRSVLMYIALVHAPATTTPGLQPAVAQAVQNISLDRSAALALAAVSLFHPELPGSRSMSINLLSGMRSPSAPAVAGPKTASVVKPQADPYVEELLKTAQIP